MIQKIPDESIKCAVCGYGPAYFECEGCSKLMHMDCTDGHKCCAEYRETLGASDVLAEVQRLCDNGQPIAATDLAMGWIYERLNEIAFHDVRDLLDAIDVAAMPTQVLTAIATLTWHARTVLHEHRERFLDRMFESFSSRVMDAAQLDRLRAMVRRP